MMKEYLIKFFVLLYARMLNAQNAASLYISFTTIARRLNLYIFTIFFCGLIAFAFPSFSATKLCVSPNDFGLGGVYTIYADPDETSADDSDLIRKDPKDQQIAPWIVTDLTTLGGQVTAENQNSNRFRIYVEGRWYPWGKSSTLPQCNMIPCIKGTDKNCLSTGTKVDVNYGTGAAPCYLTSGYGLYGLISLDGTNPNTVSYASQVPSNHFRTFHMKVTGTDQYGEYVDIPYTEFCDKDENCNKDLSGGQPVVAKGKLYFRISDTYYQDNDGFYNVQVVSGVASSKGFIQTSIEIFEQTIEQVTQAIYEGILNSNFVGIVRALLMLYIIFTALTFSLGLLQKAQQEIIMRLIKIGIIVALISPESWEFFNKYLFQLFTEGSREISKLILNIVIYDRPDALPFPVPQDANALSIMDVLMKMLISPPLWYKILTPLFTKYILYFFGMILGLFFVIFGIVRIVMLYIIAIFAMAILLAVAPIFIVMILFKLTTKIFDDWLKQLVSAAIMIIIVAILSAMLLILIVGSITALLGYGTCWDVLWAPKILGFTLFSVYWWIPQNDLGNYLTFANYGYFIVIGLVYHNLVGYIPALVDALAGAARRPISNAFNAFSGRAESFYQNTIASRVGGVISYGPDQAAKWIDRKTKEKFELKKGVIERSRGYYRAGSRAIGTMQSQFEQRFGSYSKSHDETQLRYAGKLDRSKGPTVNPYTNEFVRQNVKDKIDKYSGDLFKDK